MGPEARLSGEEDLDDDVCVEEPEEEMNAAPSVPKVWRLLARYYSIKAANYTNLHKHFMKV